MSASFSIFFTVFVVAFALLPGADGVAFEQSDCIKNAASIMLSVINFILLLSEGRQNFVGVIRDIDLVEYLCDLTFLVYKKCGPGDAHILFAVHAFLGKHSVCVTEFFVRVCD